MRYTEFENLVKLVGFKTYYCGDNLYVTRTNESDILAVNTKYANVVNTNFIHFYNYLTYGQQTQFLDIAYKLAKTPLEQREGERQYYLKTASPLVIEETKYLNYNLKTDSYFYSTVYNDEDHIKYIFTQTEVDNMDTTGLIPEPITDIGNIIQRYIDTPLKKRLEEKKYYLKTASPLVAEYMAYLTLDQSDDTYFWNDSSDAKGFQVAFTQTEIDNMDTTGLIPEPITDSEEDK